MPTSRRLTKLIKSRNSVGNGKHWLEESLDSWLEKSKNRDKRPSDCFHPSGIGDCDRAIQYNRLGFQTEKPTLGANIRVMEQGNWSEKKFKEWLEQMGILVEYQREVKIQNPPVKGKLDFIIKNPDGFDDKLYLVELKTRREEVGGVKWENLAEPYPDHLKQWTLYSKATGIVDGMIIYENKNKQEIKIFEQHLDEELANVILSRLCDIQKALDQSKIIDRPKICPNYFCDYKNRCRTEVDN